MLVVDEVYRGIAVGGAVQPPAACLAPNAVTVGGLSKVCGLAGLRIGWAVGPPLLVDDVRGYHAAASRCPAAACQALALVALDAPRRAAAAHLRPRARQPPAPRGADRPAPARAASTCPTAAAWRSPPSRSTTSTRGARGSRSSYGLLVAPGPACFGIPGRVRLNLAAERGYWRAALPLLDAELAAAAGAARRGERSGAAISGSSVLPGAVRKRRTSAPAGAAAPTGTSTRSAAPSGRARCRAGHGRSPAPTPRPRSTGAASTRTRASAGTSASPSSTSTITLAPTPSTSARRQAGAHLVQLDLGRQHQAGAWPGRDRSAAAGARDAAAPSGASTAPSHGHGPAGSTTTTALRRAGAR